MWSSSSSVDSDSKQHTSTQQQHCTDSNDAVLDYLWQIQHMYHLCFELVTRVFTNNDVLYNDADRYIGTQTADTSQTHTHTVAAVFDHMYNHNTTIQIREHACNDVNCINLQMHAASMPISSSWATYNWPAHMTALPTEYSSDRCSVDSTEFKMFTNNFLSRDDTWAQFSCSLMRLSLRTLMMLSAVTAARGTPMWTSSPTDWRPSHKAAHYSNTREVSMKLSHPWTLQQVSDEFRHWRHLLSRKM